MTDQDDREHLLAVGKRLRQARKRARLEQKELAEKVGVTEKTISNAENGVYSPYRWISKAANALGVTEGWLWLGTGQERREGGLDSDRVCALLQAILDELRLMRLDRAESRP